MPRNRLLIQIDDELIHAHGSLKFWRDQLLLLDCTQFHATARRQIMHREIDISRLLEAHEMLHDSSRP